jgi:hypothetical protein
LIGLVQVLPGAEAPLRRALTREEAGDDAWRLARALGGHPHRLLILHGGDGRRESAELAHEALIGVWPALTERARADAEFLAVRAELQHDLQRWHDADHPAGLLPAPSTLGPSSPDCAAAERNSPANKATSLCSPADAAAHDGSAPAPHGSRSPWSSPSSPP